MKNLILSLFLACLPGGCSADDQSTNQQYVSEPETAVGKKLRTHIEVLAADDMRGRQAGTQGYQKAADYVAAQFAGFGLHPLGDNGTYFQKINFLETRLVKNSASMVLHKAGRSTELEFAVDFVRYGGFGSNDEAITAPLVFVGYGIQAPGYDHDDFAGVDVEGEDSRAIFRRTPGVCK